MFLTRRIGSHISALTEIITGREIDTCPGDTRAGEPGYSTGQALYDKGTGILDIFSSEIGCRELCRLELLQRCLKCR